MTADRYPDYNKLDAKIENIRKEMAESFERIDLKMDDIKKCKESDHQKIWEAVYASGRTAPPWAVAIISFLTLLLGFAINAALH